MVRRCSGAVTCTHCFWVTESSALSRAGQEKSVACCSETQYILHRLLCGLRHTRLQCRTRPRAADFCLGVDRMTPSPRIVEVRQKVLKHNDEIARRLRRRFEDQGVFVVSLVSSPGSGKTTFLEKTLTILKQQYPSRRVGRRSRHRQ
jgi:hypothetical protein